MLAICFVAVVNSATRLLRIGQNSFGKFHRLAGVRQATRTLLLHIVTQQMSLRFHGKRIHNRRPSRINPFEDEYSVIDCSVYEKSLRHVRFVRVHVDEFPRSENRYSEQNRTQPVVALVNGGRLEWSGAREE